MLAMEDSQLDLRRLFDNKRRSDTWRLAVFCRGLLHVQLLRHQVGSRPALAAMFSSKCLNRRTFSSFKPPDSAHNRQYADSTVRVVFATSLLLSIRISNCRGLVMALLARDTCVPSSPPYACRSLHHRQLTSGEGGSMLQRTRRGVSVVSDLLSSANPQPYFYRISIFPAHGRKIETVR